MATKQLSNKNSRQNRSESSGTNQRGDRTQRMADRAQEYVERGNERFHDMVRDHEGQSVALAFAVGCGLGVLLGYALGGPSHHASNRWIDRSMAEGMGRRLLARIDQVLPEAVSSRLHH